MAVARVSEIVASSTESFDGAVRAGLKRAATTIRGITGVEVTRMQGKVEKGKLKEYRVHMNVTFVLEE
ncbi:MAG: dodecin family protein [Candidatus Binatia bacterium]